MAKIIVSILAFLLMIFPNSKYLIAEHQSLTFNMDASVSSVVNAFKAKDILTLEAMMCQNIKDNVSELRTRIGEMFDAIDGDISSISKWERGYSREERNGQMRLYHQEIRVNIAATKTYCLSIVWGIVDNVTPKETGILRITLFIPPASGTQSQLVAEIRTTGLA